MQIKRVATKLLIILGLVGLLAVSIPVIAAVFQIETKWQCSDSAHIVGILTESGSSVIATGDVGIAGSNRIHMSFWVGNNTGEWTIVATPKPNMETSCIVLYGTSYHCVW